MKKTIRKPENWQDFESLCKKLWGEVWNVPNKIKKNGRLGQPQSGVDIYAIPANESGYWGIQCKGKDEYTHAKLSKDEIEKEIEKALSFKPKLEVFIIATTSNKDVEIEEYIRLKDIESRNNDGFEILLYSWEDIVDLIEDNRDTFNYYVNEQKYKTKYDFQVYLNDFQKEHEITPIFVRKIRSYRYKKKYQGVQNPDEITALDLLQGYRGLYHNITPVSIPNFSLSRINYAICDFEIIMNNEGSAVIEDWKVRVTVEGEHSKLMDSVGSGFMGLPDLTKLQNKRTYCENNYIVYHPKNNAPLIQKDNRYFEAYIIPKGKEYKIPLKWEILARDYYAEGYIYLIVNPTFEEEIEYVEVERNEELKEDEIISIEEKKNYSENPKDDESNVEDS